MTRWIGAHGLVNLAKNVKTSPHYYVIPRKPQIQNENFFFDLS